MLQRVRESLTILLLALLPLHALFVTVATKVIAGPGHAPIGTVALWKEGILLIILGLSVVEILRSVVGGRWSVVRDGVFRVDLIDALIVALALTLFGVSAALHTSNISLFYGFKYDLFAPLAFLLLRRVPWSIVFQTHAERVLLCVGTLVAIYGILTFFLPESFFTWLGYSRAHSLYMPDGPLAAFQQIAGSSIRRIQGSMSGPNQLGVWLLIPISIVVARYGLRVTGVTRHATRHSKPVWIIIASICLFIALFLTFSRSAWLAALVILAAALLPLLPRKIIGQVLAASAALIAVVMLALALAVPQIIVRFASSREHVTRPLEALQAMIEHPLGLGFASAGPAANRTHDACVYLEEGADASWANGSPDLCVFSGVVQMQPVDRVCNCAFLPENWYLQIGVEGGIVGFVVFVALILTMLWRLRMTDDACLPDRQGLRKDSAIRHSPSAIFLVFLGISLAALFLHAWEDSAVAYTAWVLAAITLASKSHRSP